MSGVGGQAGKSVGQTGRSVLRGRRQIDEIDRELVRLLNKRMRMSIRVGHMKKACGMPLFDKAREREIYRQAARTNGGPLDQQTLTGFYRWLLAQSRRQTRRALNGTGGKGASPQPRRKRA